MNEIINLLGNSQNVNKTHEIINKKMAPPFDDIQLNYNKMNGFIDQKNNWFVHAWTSSES